MSFDILEEGDGAEIQLLYAGGADVTAHVAATVEGQRRPMPVRYDALKPGVGGPWMKMMAIVFNIGLASWFVYNGLKGDLRPTTTPGWVFVSAFLLVFVLSVAYSSFGMLRESIWPQLSAPAVPFEF